MTKLSEPLTSNDRYHIEHAIADALRCHMESGERWDYLLLAQIALDTINDILAYL